MRRKKTMKRITASVMAAVVALSGLPYQALAADSSDAGPGYELVSETESGAETTASETSAQETATDAVESAVETVAEETTSDAMTEMEIEQITSEPTAETVAEETFTEVSSEIAAEEIAETETQIIDPADEPESGISETETEAFDESEEKSGTSEIIIADWEWVDPEEYLTQDADGNWVLALGGVSEEDYPSKDDILEILPVSIMATVASSADENSEEETENTQEIALDGWTCEDYPEEEVPDGSYLFTAELPEGYVLAESALELDVTVDFGSTMLTATTFKNNSNVSSNYSSGVSSYSELSSRLEELMNKYCGTTWTSGGTCSHSSGVCYSLCYHGHQCKGFASYIFNELFKGGYIGAYDSKMYYIPSPNAASLVDMEWGLNASRAKEILSKASKGDLIQARRKYTTGGLKPYGHTMIVVDVSDDGITLFDCNSSSVNCYVKSYFQSWSTFADKNYGMSLYHSTNYPTTSSSTSTSIDYIDIGTDFEAYIINNAAWKMAAVNGSNVELQSETAYRNQLWHFYRQSDGSYEIQSVYDPNCYLDVYNGDGSGANVQIWEGNDGDAQKWYITGSQSSCHLVPKCALDCSLDVYNGNSDDGTNIQIWYTWDDASAASQNFDIYKFENIPSAPTITADAFYSDGSNVTLNWGEVAFATSYLVDIWCNNLQVKTETVYGTSFTYENAPAGVYCAYVYARNANGQNSSSFPFCVVSDIGSDRQVTILRTDIWKTIVANDGNVELGTEYGNANERWQLEHQSDGSYIITNLDTNQVLDLYNAENAEGTNIQIYTYHGDPNQRWYFIEYGGGYLLTPKSAPGMVMDVYNGDSEDGTNIQLWSFNGGVAQIFSPWTVSDAVFGSQSWVNLGNSFYADILITPANAKVTVSGQNVVFTKDDDVYTKWKFVRNGTGSYTIYSCADGKVMEVEGSGTEAGTNVCVNDYTGAANQQWYIYGESGAYYFRSACCDFVMDMNSGVYTEGVNLQMWYYNSSSDNTAQIFSIQTLDDITGSIRDCTVSVSQDSCVWDGTAKEPEVTVKNGDTVLTAGTDYTVTYSDNTDAGTAVVKLEGTGSYTGILETEFMIEPADISGCTVSEIASQVYSGGELKPSVTVSWEGSILIAGTDYEIDYRNCIAAGSAKVVLTGTGNLTGTKAVEFTIEPADISECAFAEVLNEVYDGTEKTPEVSVSRADSSLIEDIDYSLSYTDNVECGTASVLVTGIGNYTGSKTLSFEILAASVDGLTVGEIADQTYTGEAITPEVTVSDGKNVLTEDVDYTVQYRNNTNAGTASVIITGMGTYSGSLSAEFTIKAVDFESCTFGTLEDQVYTGEEQYPDPDVSWNGTELQGGKDYEMEYEDCLDVGTATLILTGIGNFEGTKELTFQITQADIADCQFEEISDVTYTGTVQTPAVKGTGANGSLTEGVDFRASYMNNQECGTATVVISGIGNYTGSQTLHFTILPKTAADFSIEEIPAQTYTGTEIQPEVKVYDGETLLTEGTDYSVSYSNNFNAGTATVTVTGMGTYDGTVVAEFVISAVALEDCDLETIADQRYTGSEITPEISVKAGDVVFEEGKDYQVSYSDNVEVGTASVELKAIAGGNLAGSRTLTFAIVEENSEALSAEFTASPANSCTAGNTVTLTASAEGGDGSYTYKFIVFDKSTQEWYKLRDYAESNTFAWTTGAAGEKILYADVQDSSGQYVRVSLNYEVTEAETEALTATLTTSPSDQAESGTAVTLTASASGGSGSYTYKFLVYNPSTDQWFRLRDFASENTYTWTAGSAGNRVFYVDVKDSDGTTVRAKAALEVTEASEPLSVDSFTASCGTKVSTYTNVTLTVEASGGSGTYQYKFIVYNETSGEWYKLRDYAASNTFTWYSGALGQKTLYVDVKDDSDTVVRKTLAITVGDVTEISASLTSSAGTSIADGSSTTLSVEATGGYGDLQYKFLIYNPTTKVWYKLRDFAEGNTLTWTASGTGSRIFYADVKDEAGQTVRVQLTVTVE